MLTIYINYATDYGDAPSQVLTSIEDETAFTFTEEHLPTLTADGYQFDGWMLDGSLIHIGDVSNIISIDTTFNLVAHWTQEKGYWGNATGGFGVPKSFIIVDEGGHEFTAVTTEDVVVFDATPGDVIVGKKFASYNGVLEGANTKTYRVRFGTQLILPGESFLIPMEEYDGYDYTQFEAMIAMFNTTKYDSVAIEKVSLYDSIYSINSNDKISDVVKNTSLKSIDLNLLNDTDDVYIIHYNTYKEEL